MVLSDSTAASPTFVTPTVIIPTALTFELVVTDNEGGVSIADTVVVTVNPLIPLSNAFQQGTGADGLVSIESEHFDVNTPVGAHSWIVDTTTGFSGESGMSASPDNGTKTDIDYAINSPRLDYLVNFTQPGTHYVWLRASGPGAGSDSLHAGLDGAEIASSDRINGFTTTWGWSNTTMDSVVATIEVTTLGLHTVNIWMREDGVALDKLVLTTNAAYAPNGTGPVESARSGNSTPTANAGVDQSVDEQMLVTLSGSGGDSDGLIVAYAWSQAGGAAVVLSDSSVANPTFTAPAVTVVTSLTFELMVTDNEGAISIADAVVITVNPLSSIAFQQDAGPDGLVSIESEHFDVNTPQGAHSWIVDTMAGFSGDSGMSGSPDNGTKFEIDYAVNSPSLDYAVNFTKLGTHYIWVRGVGPGGGSDSLHVGLDGAEIASSDRIKGFTTVWGWSNATMDSVIATIEVTTVGLHTINVWMREDGVAEVKGVRSKPTLI